MITLSFKLFQVKYSNNCIEIKDKKNNDFTKLITFVKYANKTPTKLNKNVFSDTSAFQHIYIKKIIGSQQTPELIDSIPQTNSAYPSNQHSHSKQATFYPSPSPLHHDTSRNSPDTPTEFPARHPVNVL